MWRYPILITLLFASFSLQAGSGGPDGFGYTWLDSDTAAGPTFNWIDVPNLPGAIQVNGLADDNSAGPFSLGFDFRYYWVDYDKIKIGSNGWLSFEDPTNLGSCFQSMPTASNTPNSTLAPFMSDLSFTSSYATLPNIGEVWCWSNNQDSFVVSYLDVPWWNTDNSGTTPPDWIGANSFQIILDATDSSITYQYLSLSSNDLPLYPCQNDLIIGIEDPLGTNGLQLYQETFPPDSFAIEFIYPKEDTFEVIDAGAVANLNPQSKGQIFFTENDIPLNSTLANLGNTPFQSDLIVQHKVLNRQFQLQWQKTDTVMPIPVGGDSLFEFVYPMGLTDPGQYYFESKLFSSEDVNDNNDEITAELLLIEDGLEYHELCFCTGFNPDAVLAWPVSFAGKYGGAVFYEPPFTGGTTIDTVEAWIEGNDGLPQTPLLADFRIEILLPDSAGMPGTVLASKQVSRFDAIEDNWNKIGFDPPVPVDSGGFFVAWLQLGNGIGLGAETIGPKSRQSFEVVADDWGPYRFRNGQDLLLRARVRDLLLPVDGTVEVPALSAWIAPNPGVDRFEVGFELQSPAVVRIEVLDLSGKVLLQQAAGKLAPGQQKIALDASVPPGIYLVRLQAGQATQTFKWSSVR